MDRYFDIGRFINGIPQLLPYLKVTIGMVATFMLLGTLLGVIVAMLRIQKIPVIHQLLGVYISFMRGTPILVQLLLSYYGIPMLASGLFGLDINSWNKLVYVIIAFTLNEGAFLGEIFRGAIEAVPPVQTEAAYTIGMTKLQTFFRIILPQSVRIAIPAYGVDFVGAFQGTAVAFMIGVMDLMGRAQTIGAATSHALEPYLVVTIIYVIISILLKFFFGKLDQRLSISAGEVAR